MIALENAGVAVLDCVHATPKDAGEGFPYIAIPNIQDGRVQLEGVRRISLLDLEKWTAKTAPQPGDILVTRRGRVGDTAPIPSDLRCAIGQNLVLLRSDGEHVDQAYLKWATRGPLWMAEVDRLRNVGAVFDSLNVRDIARLRIPVPPLDEQRRIAEVLGALDDLIDTNERQIERLGHLVAELYQLALARGVPRVLPFLDVFKVEFGGAFKGSYFTNPGVGLPLIRIRDLKTASSDTWTTERLPNDVVIAPGDILFGMDAEFRASQWVGPTSLLNQRVCRVTAPGASNAFVLEALKAPLAYIEGHKTGTTVIHLNKRDLEETSVLIPSDTAVSEFDAVAEPLRLWSVSLSAENEQLRRTRDELLPLLMSGAVRVRPEVVAA